MNQNEADEKVNQGRKMLWGSEVKYSDQLANGDLDDDKEVEDEEDPEDIVADDDGFVRQWRNH